MNHCECNMNCDPHLTARIKHVYGNVLRLAIPLTLRSLMKDGDTIVATDSDFIPSSEYPVNVVFGKGNKNIAIPAEMDGNVAIIEEKGKMPVGTYDITVECRDDLGQPYRFKKDTVLQVVDVTAEAGIEPTIEYEAQTWYLDAAIFLATTEIGSMSEEIERRLEDVFGDVDYDAENKEIVFYDKNKTHVLGTIDSRPFIVDGTVDDVYIDVSRQVLVVILNEDAGGRRFSVPLYLVFDNYYKKDEVDSKVGHKADVLGDGRLPGAEATPVVLDYIYAPPSGSPIIPINPQAGEVIYFANEHKIRRYYYEYAGQSGGLPAIVYVEETPSRYVVYHNKRDEKFYRYDAGLLSMVEIETGSGGGEGTVTGVKVGGTTYEPTDGVVDISAGIPDVSGFATAGDVADAVADLVDSAPDTLDTLKELADALGDDPNFATTMTTALGNKVDKVTGKGLSTEDYTTAEKSKLEGLSNYDDTALQAAVAGKVDKETGKSLMTDAEHTKLAGIASGAETNVQADWEQTTATADDYIKNKPTLATVATSGSYNDLSNKPTLFSGNYNDLTNKPTIPDVSGLATKSEVATGLATKQDTLTFDNAPTANSNNPVKSGGVKTALDEKANAADVPTNQDMADAIDDALGEAQVAVVPAGSIGVISSLGSDSNSDALSANMGRKLKVALMTVLNSIGTYAFPNGRPTLDFSDEDEYVVQKTIGTGLSATGGDTVVSEGDPLEVTIVITNNMYIVDDDSVVVTMGGSPVAGAWNASTMKVTIAAVYGDVVINVPSLTYVGYGEQNSPLVFNLDGFNRGGVAGHWTDLAGNVDFALTNCTENSDNVEFNGTSSKGVSSGSLNVRYDEGTIESIFDVSASDFPTNIQCILTNNINQGISIGLGKGAAIDPSKSLYCYVNSTGTVPNSGVLGLDNVIKTKQQVCFYKLHGYRNGVALTDASPNDGISFTIDSSTQLALGTRHRSSSDNYMKGKIFMVRVYNRVLTDSERAQNYKVDKKRYNLS